MVRVFVFLTVDRSWKSAGLGRYAAIEARCKPFFPSITPKPGKHPLGLILCSYRSRSTVCDSGLPACIAFVCICLLCCPLLGDLFYTPFLAWPCVAMLGPILPCPALRPPSIPRQSMESSLASLDAAAAADAFFSGQHSMPRHCSSKLQQQPWLMRLEWCTRYEKRDVASRD